MTGRPLEAALAEGAAALEVSLSTAQIAQLLDYQALLQKWGTVYNLTAVRDPADMLRHHLLDSLAVVNPWRRHDALAPPDRPKRVLDVGAGAGLPGIVLAICCPELQVDCVDTVAKKAAFIQQVAVSLRLPQLRGIHARVENLTGQYTVVTSRAFASLRDFTRLSAHALAPYGVWMAMKGKPPEGEVAELPANVQVFHVEPLAVPGLEAQRCLVWMRRSAAIS